MSGTSIRAHEKQLYSDAWALESYAKHSPGEQYADIFASTVVGRHGRTTVLDAGCGSGKGGLRLEALGFSVTLADQTPDGLTDEAMRLPFKTFCIWDDLVLTIGRFDHVYCCDVLEHLPTQFTMLALDRLLSISRKSLFFSVCLTPDHFGAWVGRPLHQTVQPFVWWRDSLRELGTLIEARDLLTDAIFVVQPGRSRAQ